jgi:uncharacterized membrane protein
MPSSFLKGNSRTFTVYRAATGAQPKLLKRTGLFVDSSNTHTSLRAFIWARGGKPRDLGALPGDRSSEAFGINKHNEAVGYSNGPRGIEAVLWSSEGKIQGPAKFSDGDNSRSYAINELGEVVGSPGNAKRKQAFIWVKNDGLKDLGALFDTGNSEALSINSRGEVIGYSIILGQTRISLDQKWRYARLRYLARRLQPCPVH